MSQDVAPNETAAMPTLPERSMRRSDDLGRPSESYESKRPWRQSEQPSTLRPSMPYSGLSRPSDDAPQHVHCPTQQLTHYQPPLESQPPKQPSSTQPVYARGQSQDYAGFDDFDSAPGKDFYLVPHSADDGGPYHRTDPSINQPYRRPTVRESTEIYRPLHSAQTPRRQPRNQMRWLDEEEEEEVTPRKRTPMKGQMYLVRAGGDGGDGSQPPDEIMRLPFMSWMQGTAKNHFIAVLGEFVGTTMFLFFAFAGTLVANIGATESAANTTTNATVGFSPIVNLYVAVSFGFSLMVNVWIFFRVSGGLFNPAVTLGMVMTKSINYTRGFLLVCAQLAGAIVASFIVQVLFPSDFNVRTTLAADTSIARGLIIEAFLTAELVFTVFMLAKEKHRATYMAPVGIGLSLFVAELVGVFFTGGSLNPARSFGPCVATRKFDSEHWIYWLGPAIGAIAAFMFYKFIKILEYEMANPGQDAEDPETARLEAKETRGEV